MKYTRRSVLGLAGAGSVVAIAGCLGGGGDGDTTESTTTTDGGMDGPTVAVSSHPEHGDILADAEGMTLYLFTTDSDGESACYDSCADAWPPLTLDGEPTAGDGVTASLGTTERDDGSTQVTAAGHPLYYFASDEEPGDAKGQGVNDAWYVLAPDGSQVGGMETTTTTTSDGGGDTTTEDDGPDY